MSSLVESLPEGTTVADGYDDALIGYAFREGEPVAVYDRDACIKSLFLSYRSACVHKGKCEEDHYQEAEEFFEYNTVRASDYIGAKAPLYVTLLKGVKP